MAGRDRTVVCGQFTALKKNNRDRNQKMMPRIWTVSAACASSPSRKERIEAALHCDPFRHKSKRNGSGAPHQ